MQELETEVTEYNWHPVAAEQKAYPGTREANRVVKEYNEKCRVLYENPWALFDCIQGFKLASWFIESKVSKTQIHNYF